eukprot:TRINITY_DN4781_c0_g1_i1.p1 TRINITY_DN4781_c0_g1~~TRINITY_DN4781_c0_g1_i1.p1  ORF type:complete len:392 (+),score=84.58 TRINITY_DN4781_c0_g1_i1:75-1250(+)
MSLAAAAAGAGLCSAGLCFGGLAGAAFAKLLAPGARNDAGGARRGGHRARGLSSLNECSDSDEMPKRSRVRGQTKEPAAAASAGRRRSAAGGMSAVDEFYEPPTAGWEGFSMEEAIKQADSDQQRALARSPAEVLAQLQKGNARFWMGAATRPEKSAFERRALISKQFPCVAILGCSDSRVPVEIVFDMGLGDMFVIRVAGNCLDTSTMASLQYAIHHLHVKVVIVMGHEGCGAVKAAGQAEEAFSSEPKELKTLLSFLKGGLDDSRLGCITDSRAHDREAVVTNVRQQLTALSRDEGIMTKAMKKEIIVVGAFYEISSGIVDFFFELTEPISTKEDVVVRRGMSRGVQSCLGSGTPKSPARSPQLMCLKPQAVKTGDLLPQSMFMRSHSS